MLSRHLPQCSSNFLPIDFAYFSWLVHCLNKYRSLRISIISQSVILYATNNICPVGYLKWIRSERNISHKWQSFSHVNKVLKTKDLENHILHPQQANAYGFKPVCSYAIFPLFPAMENSWAVFLQLHAVVCAKEFTKKVFLLNEL